MYFSCLCRESWIRAESIRLSSGGSRRKTMPIRSVLDLGIEPRAGNADLHERRRCRYRDRIDAGPTYAPHPGPGRRMSPEAAPSYSKEPSHPSSKTSPTQGRETKLCRVLDTWVKAVVQKHGRLAPSGVTISDSKYPQLPFENADSVAPRFRMPETSCCPVVANA